MTDDISQLVYLHLRFHGYGDGKWTDSARCAAITDAGALRGCTLVRADCTTRNKRRAARLQASTTGWKSGSRSWPPRGSGVRPDLTVIMAVLDIPAGLQVWRGVALLEGSWC